MFTRALPSSKHLVRFGCRAGLEARTLTFMDAVFSSNHAPTFATADTRKFLMISPTFILRARGADLD
jgi:hypothetical protein